MPLFQSNLRKQIRKLPKILQFVKIIHYYSELFTSLLRYEPPKLAEDDLPPDEETEQLITDLESNFESIEEILEALSERASIKRKVKRQTSAPPVSLDLSFDRESVDQNYFKGRTSDVYVDVFADV